jgi:hypothetical protein
MRLAAGTFQHNPVRSKPLAFARLACKRAAWMVGIRPARKRAPRATAGPARGLPLRGYPHGGPQKMESQIKRGGSHRAIGHSRHSRPRVLSKIFWPRICQAPHPRPNYFASHSPVT